MEMKQEIERIAKLRGKDVGPTEENVKLKVMVPLLELLGHKREGLEFEYRTGRGGKIDIFIKNVPRDCKVIIDTKNYNENLNNYIEQIKEYTFDEAALLAVIANGTEIRIYSPLRGVAFERSLLYSIKIQDLSKESVWSTLSDILNFKNLKNRDVLKRIDERERQIKDAMTKEDQLRQKYEEKIENINGDIETKEEEIEQLKKEGEGLAEELDTNISKIWDTLGLPSEFFISHPSIIPHRKKTVKYPSAPAKARRVTLQELVNEGLVKDGQTLYFYHTRLFKDEQTKIIASSNRLVYKGKTYSVSGLAKELLIKYGFKHDDHGVAGPLYWQTENGKLLNNLNEELRKKRGDRR
ncbi:MAG: hypothetical protein ABIA56_03445 [Actinomycetota bacterium]